MLNDQVVNKLLDLACPSIKYRVRSEILGQSKSSDEMVSLQDQLLHDPLVKEIMEWQQADGWLAWDFHGTKSLEAGIRILREKGINQDHPVFSQALIALEKYPERLNRGIGKVGKILDDQGLGGSELIRAVIYSYVGVENNPFIDEQINASLSSFDEVLKFNSIDDLTCPFKNKLVFKPDTRWPSIYHLRLLAGTKKWRSPENLRMISNAVKRLISLSPLPDIYLQHKSQLIAPASFCMHDFNPDMKTMGNAQWMMWFHRMECLSRTGIIHLTPELGNQIDRLVEILEGNCGWFTLNLRHPYFTQWGAYSGLMLERNWRSPQRRIFDLTFRCLLILHYSGKIKESC